MAGDARLGGAGGSGRLNGEPRLPTRGCLYTNFMERVVLDPAISSGKPTIRGTRILVSVVLGMLAGGYSVERVLSAYPELTRDDVLAAIAYASDLVDGERAASVG